MELLELLNYLSQQQETEDVALALQQQQDQIESMQYQIDSLSQQMTDFANAISLEEKFVLVLFFIAFLIMLHNQNKNKKRIKKLEAVISNSDSKIAG